MRQHRAGLPFSYVVRRVSLNSRGVGLACLLGIGIASSGARPANADEFSTIAPGDKIYTQLATLRQGPWGGDPVSSTHSLTRYEVAIETAKAILKVNAAYNANPKTLPASRSALHALRALTVTLNPELSRLDIDVPGTLRLLDRLTSTSSNISESTTERSTVVTHKLGGANDSLARRLRLYSALSAVARDTNDPFGDNTNEFAAHGLMAPRTGLVGSAVSGSSAFAGTQPEALGGGVQTGAAIGLTNWMQVRAGFAAKNLTPGGAPWNGLRAPMLANAREERSVGTGVDVALPLGLTVSGDVARVSATSLRGSAPQLGTRYGGALNLSAWQNRLSLTANLSRLVPEDSDALPSTATEFNLGVGVTSRLQLTLLYQQMFSASRTTGNDRAVSGGISVKF